MITVSAPGKLMLMGEHAVVYGFPSLVTAIDERLTVEVEKIAKSNVVVDAPQASDTRFVDEAVRQAQKKWDIPLGGFRIKTQSKFSGKYGFGSSASVTVTLLKALALLFQKQVNQSELFDISYKTVLAVQGVGSGFDVAAAVYGGTLYFVGGGKVIEEIHARYRESNDQTVSEMPLIVGYTGVKADTTTLIKQVAEKRDKNPEKVERIFQGIAKLVDDAKQKMREGDWERVGKLMDFNQEYLRDLGVSSEKLEAMISAAKKAGAWGAKLSGAGGGDCIVALASSVKREAVRRAIADVEGQVIDVRANTQGVCIETTDDQKEEFIVVDRDDKVLGFRSRYDCHHDKSLIHRAVNLLIFDDQGRVLLQKRSMSKDTSPGLWSTSVSGHVAKGEDYAQAIHRETREELGVDISVVQAQKFIHEFPYETEMEVLFTAESNGPFHPNLEEIDRIEFISKNDLPRKLLSKEIELTSFTERALKIVGFLL